jgi:lamin-B receptor
VSEEKPRAVKAKPKVVKKEPVEKTMAFAEGDEVMARWPGSSLFFKAKVTMVREEEDEYDVEYENGTVYTIRAKDVYKASSKIMKKAGSRRSKSKSRGRSAAREKKPKAAEVVSEAEVSAEFSADEEAAPKTEDVADAPVEEPKVEEEPKEVEEPVVVKAPKVKAVKVIKAETPTRKSARVAAKAISDAFSDDESEKIKLAPNPELPDARGRKKGWSFEWVWAIIFMILGPVILVSLHTLCTKSGCKLETPKFSTKHTDYINKDAIIQLAGFYALLKISSFIPLGSIVNGQRMNGFTTLLVLLSAVPALVYYKVPLSSVRKNYFFLMASCIIASFLSAIVFYISSFWAAKSNINSKGNTGNPIVDIFNGRTVSPKFLGSDAKLTTFRFSMIGLAVLNVLMVTDSIVSSGGKASPTVILAAAFQVLYSMDAMFFEEYYFHSHDAMNSGFGWSLISSYLTFPFLPTLITKYLLDRSPVVAWYYLTLIGLMNALGYIIFRSSETQRCEFAKNPSNPALAHLETVSTAGNRKLIVSGWWGLVRHPNYLGEVLIQWSWVLPAVGALGFTDLVPYYLPFVTTLMLVIRCHQINQRNKRKYGSAWNSYCEKVRSNIIPKVY